jgi:hypothetical protein
VQSANFFRDRARVKVTFQRNMQFINDPYHLPDLTFTVITITNVGRRPVMVRNAFMQFRGNAGAVFTDIQPRIPCELTEGKFITVTVEQSKLDFPEIAYFAASNSAGRKFCAPVAPLHKRAWWSVCRRWPRGRMVAGQEKGKKTECERERT